MDSLKKKNTRGEDKPNKIGLFYIGSLPIDMQISKREVSAITNLISTFKWEKHKEKDL